MSWFYPNCLRPVLFTQDSETVHDLTLRGLSWVSRFPVLCEALHSRFGGPDLPVSLWRLSFPNPVGLAAGMDKRAQALPAWAALGFGFTEVGGVTWHAQPGNPSPRMFRAVAEQALVNRMGFNNDGAMALAAQLHRWRRAGLWPSHPVGVNLGKSKMTPLAEAAPDYRRSFELLRPLADFFVVNVSSPNTPGLRELQDKTALDDILAALQEVNQPDPKPILVKIAPDLSWLALDAILSLTTPRRVAGLIATNTTITRPHVAEALSRSALAEEGGLSGRPLRQRSTEVIRHLFTQTQGRLPIIGVGGVFDADDAWEKITAGASLIQLYTGLVYRGPSLVREIVEGLRDRLRAEGLTSLHEAVGRQLTRNSHQ